MSSREILARWFYYLPSIVRIDVGLYLSGKPYEYYLIWERNSL
ncbi:hypothetical protein Sgly_1785 [Syntrophobotulus glycolicus DSM 8271]|uniref:Uncharacterized protein n=1 Tax=Syntrophobotulus glycolicus (strain DSM 8271 / FlGlyR) TaxID=645991 RepID=F0SZJ6_SYNGF|nr:hypothetical protein Sgly_1785 [Syntrophobotulus glycolicus DSM 8271]